MVVVCPPAKPRWSEVMIILCDFLRQKGACPEVGVSSDERSAHRKTDCDNEISSGERMFAGAGSVAGDRTSAKPRWSEVMIILCDFLRQGSPLQEETANSDERSAHRKTDCDSEISSGERLFAGAGCIAGGCTSAKPRWSEVIIFWMISSGREALRRRKINKAHYFSGYSVFFMLLYSKMDSRRNAQ